MSLRGRPHSKNDDDAAARHCTARARSRRLRTGDAMSCVPFYESLHRVECPSDRVPFSCYFIMKCQFLVSYRTQEVCPPVIVKKTNKEKTKEFILIMNCDGSYSKGNCEASKIFRHDKCNKYFTIKDGLKLNTKKSPSAFASHRM